MISCRLTKLSPGALIAYIFIVTVIARKPHYSNSHISASVIVIMLCHLHFPVSTFPMSSVHLPNSKLRKIHEDGTEKYQNERSLTLAAKDSSGQCATAPIEDSALNERGGDWRLPGLPTPFLARF